MRLIVATLVLALSACGSEDQQQSDSAPSAASVEMPAAATAASARSVPPMAIPDDPEALKRLEAMGYTIHEEEGHLHAPGVTSCPAMGSGPTM